MEVLCQVLLLVAILELVTVHTNLHDAYSLVNIAQRASFPSPPIKPAALIRNASDASALVCAAVRRENAPQRFAESTTAPTKVSQSYARSTKRDCGTARITAMRQAMFYQESFP